MFVWAIEVMHIDLTKYNMAALNNERLAKFWNPSNVKLQMRYCNLCFNVSHEKPDADECLHLFSDPALYTRR